MFISLLTVLFIGLKLAGILQWSWLWVLAPIWIEAIVGITIAGFALGMAYLVSK